MKFLVKSAGSLKQPLNILIQATLGIAFVGCSYFSPDSTATNMQTQIPTQTQNLDTLQSPAQSQAAPLRQPTAPSVGNAVGYTRVDSPSNRYYRNYLGYIPTLISIDYGATQNTYNRYAPSVESYARMSVDVFNRDFPSLLGQKGLQIVEYYPSYPLSVEQSNALPAVFYSRVYITMKEFQGSTLNLTPEQIEEIKKAKNPEPETKDVSQAAQQLAGGDQPYSPEIEATMSRLAEEGADPALNKRNLALSEAGVSRNPNAASKANKKAPNPWANIDLPPETPSSLTISMRGEIMLIEPSSGEIIWAAGSLWREAVIDMRQGDFNQAIQSYIYHHSIALRDELLNHLERAPSVVLSEVIDEMRLMKGLPKYPNAPEW